MATLALFDFDGTLTNRDSFPDFLRFAVGKPRFFLGAILLLPLLCLYALKFITNGTAKEKVLKHFFYGWEKIRLQEIGNRYAQERIPKILRPEAEGQLNWHIEQGHTVCLVSASPSIWLESWTQSKKIRLIATHLEMSADCFTGKLAGNNCYGEEKVQQIKKHFDLNAFDTIYAYGDSEGDRPMLALADKPFYKPFE